MMARLQAGAARRDITPSVGIELAGYTPRVRRTNRSQGIHDSLWARVLALESCRSTALLITLDLLGIERATTHQLRSEICRQLPLQPHAIAICCTHNHSGPSLLCDHETHVEVDEGWVREAKTDIVDAAVEAFEGLRPAWVGFGRTAVQGVGANRRAVLDGGSLFHFSGLHGREPPPGRTVVQESIVDPELAVLAVKDENGRLVALLTNYACHAWIYNGDRISSELPGACVEWLEEHLVSENPDLVALFAPGTGSNITTVQHQVSIPEEIEAKESWYAEERDRFGGILGRAAIRALQSIPTYTGNATVSSQVRPVLAPVYDRVLGEILAEHGYLPPTDLIMETEIQVIQVGEITVIGLPSEVYVEYGLEIKERSIYNDIMVLSYCNDYFADLITRQAVEEAKCPELAWTKVHPDVRGRMMDELAAAGVLQ